MLVVSSLSLKSGSADASLSSELFQKVQILSDKVQLLDINVAAISQGFGRDFRSASEDAQGLADAIGHFADRITAL